MTTPATSTPTPAPAMGTLSTEPPSTPKLSDAQIAQMRIDLKEELRKEFQAKEETVEDAIGSVPFGQFMKKMEVFGPDVDPNDPIPGFHLHWINDEGDKIMRAQMRGYAFVEPSEIKLNPDLAPRNKDLGTHVSLYVGTSAAGQPMRAFLMKIDLSTYRKYRDAEQRHNDSIEQAIKRGAVGAQRGDERYVPNHTPIKYNPGA